MNYLDAVVETKDIRACDGGAVDSEAGVEVGIGLLGPRGDEGRHIPFIRPVVQVGDQVLRAVMCRDWAVAGDDGG